MPKKKDKKKAVEEEWYDDEAEKKVTATGNDEVADGSGGEGDGKSSAAGKTKKGTDEIGYNPKFYRF